MRSHKIKREKNRKHYSGLIFTISSLADKLFSAKKTELKEQIAREIQINATIFGSGRTIGEIRYSNERKKQYEGVKRYPISFYKIRVRIMERDGWICKRCGTKKDLVVHHIDSNKQNSSPDNLITVCHTHNMRAIYNRNYWERFYKQRINNYGI